VIKIPQVFVITGTPGTGKTTVSRILSKKLDALHIELSKYAKMNGYVLEEDEERDTSIVDMDALSKAIRKEITSNPVIIDGHYGQDLLDSDEVERVIILRKQPMDLKPILEDRGYTSEKVWENLEAEIMGVITHQSIEMYPEEKLIEVDTSDKTSGETADEVLAVMKREVIIKPIDWVTHPKTIKLLVSRPCTLS
jgi:adenylate kinase